MQKTLASPKRLYQFFPEKEEHWITQPVSVPWDKAMELMFEDYGHNVYDELKKKKGALYLYTGSDQPKFKPMEQFVEEVQFYLSEFSQAMEKVKNSKVLIYNWQQKNVDSMRASSVYNLDGYFMFILNHLAKR